MGATLGNSLAKPSKRVKRKKDQAGVLQSCLCRRQAFSWADLSARHHVFESFATVDEEGPVRLVRRAMKLKELLGSAVAQY